MANAHYDIVRDARVLDGLIEPDPGSVVGVDNDVVAVQAVLGIVVLNGGHFPDRLRIVPAVAAEEVVLDEHILEIRPASGQGTDAADAVIDKAAVAHDMMAPDAFEQVIVTQKAHV